MAAQLPPAGITKRIQDGYQDFHRQYSDLSTGMQLDLFTNDSALYISMNPNQDHFTCTRNAFYYSLFLFRLSDPSDTERTIQFNNTNNNRFNKCAAQGIHHEDEAEVDPVDMAIHAYSKLISILIRGNRQEQKYASYVVEFLKMNPENYQTNKMITFMLLGDNLNKERDNSALRVSPELFNEFMQIPRVQEIILLSLSSLSQNSGNRGSDGGGGGRRKSKSKSRSKSKSKSNKHKVQTKKTHRSRFNKSK